MSPNYPIDEDIYVLKNGEKLGPFDVEELLDKLEAGELSYEDVCLRDSAVETERIRDLLDWEPMVAPEDDKDEEEDNEWADEATEDGDGEVPEEETTGLLSPNAILYRGHPSILNSPVALFAILGGIAAGVWLYPADHRLTVAGFLVAISGLCYLSYIRFTHDYIITPRRIELVTGLVARSSQEVRIADIRAINVSCKGLAGAFGIGSAEFFTSGDKPEIVFQDIWRARRVKRLVRKLQDEMP